MAKRKIEKTERLFLEAKKYFPGGVNSPVRSFNYVGGKPLLIKKADNSKVYDYDGHKYIDYVLSWGALILGHRHPQVINDLEQALKDGLSFGTTNIKEIQLAQAIQKAIPFIENMRFVNSGTEAIMGAVRLARGVTKREKIIKFEHSYHGHADYLLAKSGSGLATLNIASSAGVPEDFIKQTIIAPFGNYEFIEDVFRKEGKNIAAVLVEPVGANYGIILPDADFLRKLAVITKQYGTLLIFDEVITGFRFHYGSFAQSANIVPDLICLGKIIGGGLPIGAYGGKKRLMQQLAPL
ncbi:MAG: glutamate-1-semialdehyde 2,1-aminomutase, partial [Candidatus Omnitrophica bacterium]|nr:glutamate-1-semialdehyde 2,1-aminomutase [Candidatus Omnitrophota bacterium]